MFDLALAIAYLVLGLSFGTFVGTRIGHILYERWRGPVVEHEVVYKGLREENAQFCADCGRPTVSFRAQHGFVAETGWPRWVEDRGCPAASMAMAGVPMVIGGSFVQRTCGQRVITTLARLPHDDHSLGEVDPKCQRCVEQMIEDGIIKVADGRKLLA